MPWCTKCKSEYKQGYTYCRDCKNPLVATLEGNKEEIMDSSVAETDEIWVFLISCSNDQEASMIESFLTAENIALQRKYGGASEYLKIAWGMTMLGADLYVKESQFEEAQKIIFEVLGAKKADHKMEQIVNSEGTTWNKGRKRLFLISVISLVFILGSILASIWSTIKDISG